MTTDASLVQGRDVLCGLRVCMTLWGNLRHEARVVRAAATLADAGAQVTVIASNWDDSLPARERHALGFDVIRVRRPAPLALAGDESDIRPSPPRVLWRYVRALRGHLRMCWEAWRFHADVYHANDIVPLVTTWLAATLRRRPFVYDAHEISTDREAFQNITALVRRVEGFAARRAAAMITTTDMRAEHFIAEYGVARPSIVQNRPLYYPVTPSRRLRDALAIPEQAPIFLYQGGLQQGRGLPELIERIPDVPGAHFVFMGPGNLRPRLVERAAALGLSERVHFPPPVPWEALSEWTASADVGVQLIQNTCFNHYSTDSNKLFEYAMAGLPVIVSDFPEIRRVVETHGFGWLVDPADAEAVVEALRRLATDATLRARLAEAARRAAPQLSWETQAPVLLGIYQDLRAR